jgi:hypothetical protein
MVWSHVGAFRCDLPAARSGAAAAPAIPAFWFGLALFGNKCVVGGIECQRNNGPLGICQERSHYAGGKSPTDPSPGPSSTCLVKVGNENGANRRIRCSGAHSGRIRCMRGENRRIKELLWCPVSCARLKCGTQNGPNRRIGCPGTHSGRIRCMRGENRRIKHLLRCLVTTASAHLSCSCMTGHF